jgi:hypothetical protein
MTAHNGNQAPEKKTFRFGDYVWTISFILLGIFLIIAVIILVWTWEREMFTIPRKALGG